MSENQNQATQGTPRRILDADLENWFTYHAPTGEQQSKYLLIRATALDFARILVNNTPAGPDQSAAIRQLRECVMTANQAIACAGPGVGQGATAGVGGATTGRSAGSGG